MMPSFWAENTKEGGAIIRVDNRQDSRFAVAFADMKEDTMSEGIWVLVHVSSIYIYVWHLDK